MDGIKEPPYCESFYPLRLKMNFNLIYNVHNRVAVHLKSNNSLVKFEYLYFKQFKQYKLVVSQGVDIAWERLHYDRT